MYTRVGNSIISKDSSNLILPCEFLAINPRSHMLHYTNKIPRHYFDSASIAEVGETLFRINIYDKQGQRPASISFETKKEAEEMLENLLRCVNQQGREEHEEESQQDDDENEDSEEGESQQED